MAETTTIRAKAAPSPLNLLPSRVTTSQGDFQGFFTAARQGVQRGKTGAKADRSKGQATDANAPEGADPAATPESEAAARPLEENQKASESPRGDHKPAKESRKKHEEDDSSAADAEAAVTTTQPAETASDAPAEASEGDEAAEEEVAQIAQTAGQAAQLPESKDPDASRAPQKTPSGEGHDPTPLPESALDQRLAAQAEEVQTPPQKDPNDAAKAAARMAADDGKKESPKQVEPPAEPETPAEKSAAAVQETPRESRHEPRRPADARVAGGGRNSAKDASLSGNGNQSKDEAAVDAAGPMVMAQAVKTSAEAAAATATETLAKQPEEGTSTETKPSAAPSAAPAEMRNGVATSAKGAADAQESPKTAHESTFEQIVLGLRSKLDARNGNAEIQLDPPNLGRLHVSIHLENGSLTAQFQSENASVRDLLLSQLDKLKGVLEGQGLTVDRLAVVPNSVNTSADGPQSASPPQRFPDSANPDGRSGGNNGYSGQQRQDTPRDRSFAAMWQEAREAPIDLVA